MNSKAEYLAVSSTINTLQCKLSLYSRVVTVCQLQLHPFSDHPSTCGHDTGLRETKAHFKFREW